MHEVTAPGTGRQAQLRIRLSAVTEARLVAWQLEALRQGMPKPTYGDLVEQLIEFAASSGFEVARPSVGPQRMSA